MYAELTSSHYWRSPLVQGGLETICKISIKIHSSSNEAVFERLGYGERASAKKNV